MKVKDIISLNKLLYGRFYQGSHSPEFQKTRIFPRISKDRSSMIFHLSKVKPLRLGLNTLSYDGAKLWKKFLWSNFLSAEGVYLTNESRRCSCERRIFLTFTIKRFLSHFLFFFSFFFFSFFSVLREYLSI